jgi:hypothetical protein
MRSHLSPLTIALAFTKAWASQDLALAASFVDEDIVFEGPAAQQTAGAAPYLDNLARLAEGVTSMQVLAAFGDAHMAMVMYNLSRAHLGMQSCAKCLTVANGKIQRDRQVFASARAAA